MGGQVPVRIDAAASFAALARDLRRAAAGELRRELYKGLQRAARPTLDAIPRGAGRLPQRGGLATRVARIRPTVRVLAGRPGDARIRITARERDSAPVDVSKLDRGRLRHKTFGRGVTKRGKSLWFDQRVPPGWFTDPIEANAKAFEKELNAAVDKLTDEINRG